MSETTFVTSEELVARGISADAQRRGRHRGDLLFASAGADKFVYRNADVEAWIQSDIETNATSGKAIARYVAERDGRQTAPAPPGRQNVPASGTAKTTWKVAVAGHVAAGMSRDKAIAAVDRERPRLRQAMLAEVNAR